MDFDKLLMKALNLLVKRINPVVVYLFGSAARNEMRNDSDVDIAYLSDVKLSQYENFMLAQELADIFNRDVDLINLRESSTVFKAQVVGTGKRIYCSDENRRMYFEMRAFKEYALLNEERAIILRRIKERGSVYGK
jgi:predicted nucleotidyltransferase